MAHEIPYVATATVAGLRDLEYKVQQAMEFRGARYLHVLVPCPLGWGSASGDTIKIARLAEQTGLFPVFEAVAGEVVSVTPIRRQAPVEEYLRLQTRYAHLFKSPEGAATIARLQQIADRNIARFGLLGPAKPTSGPAADPDDIFTGQLPPADAHIPPVTDAPATSQAH
jgi:pyruvate ferredoxin oxidoreductase beta subunit